MNALDLNNLPIYIPNAPVCHVKQYQCCKNRTHCRLWDRCSQIEQPEHPSSIALSEEDCNDINDERFKIEKRRLQEQIKYEKAHAHRLYFYKCFFGNELQKRAEYRQQNRDKINKQQNQRYREQKLLNGLFVNDSDRLEFTELEQEFLPCSGDCFSCEFEDCIVSAEDIKRAKQKAYNRTYYLEHKDSFYFAGKKYRAKKKEENPRFYAEQYAKYKNKYLESSKCYYQEHKEERREYNKKYREKHAEELKRKKAAYRKAHREELARKERERYYMKKNKAVPN